MKRAFFLAAALGLLTPAAVGAAVRAAPLAASGAFTYSNQCFSRLSGDLYGYRITLLRVSALPAPPSKFLSVVFYLEGEEPRLVSGAYDPRTGALRFEVQEDDAPNPPWKFDGVVDTKELKGQGLGARGAFTLPAISNSVSRIPFCK